MFRQLKFKQAQSVLEYTIIMGIITIVIFSMSILIKRSVQGMVKIVADQVGNQENSEQKFDKDGHLENSITFIQASYDSNLIELNRSHFKVYQDRVKITTKTYSNAGLTDTDPYKDNDN
jgi:hypothetical protein